MGWQDVMPYASSIAGVLLTAFGTMTWFFVRKTVGLIKKIYYWCSKEYEQLQSDRERIKCIWSEIQPNGGGTIKDAICSIEVIAKNTQKTLDFVIDSEAEGYFETDANGKCTKASMQYLAMTGSTSEMTLGNGWLLGIAENDRHRVYDEWKSAMEQGRDFELDYLIIDRTTHEEFRVHCLARRVSLSNKKLAGYIGRIRKLPNDVRTTQEIRAADIDRKQQPNSAQQHSASLDTSYDHDTNVSNIKSDIDANAAEPR